MGLLNTLTGTAGFFVQSTPDSFKETFNFLQGNGVYEEGMMHFLHEMKNTIWTHYDAFIVYFGETDHVIPWQTDHLNCWRTIAADAIGMVSKVMI